MYSIFKKKKATNLFFVDILKTTDEKSRTRIRTVTQGCGSGSVLKFHGSTKLVLRSDRYLQIRIWIIQRWDADTAFTGTIIPDPQFSLLVCRSQHKLYGIGVEPVPVIRSTILKMT
jgi:hypothetical protein